METKDKVATAAQSKVLFELGFVIDSEFIWYENPSSKKWYICHRAVKIGTAVKQYPAPMAIEIIKIFPNTWDMYIDILCLEKYTVKCWERIKKKSSRSQLIHALSSDSLAQALADMLIWLLENNRLKVENL